MWIGQFQLTQSVGWLRTAIPQCFLSGLLKTQVSKMQRCSDRWRFTVSLNTCPFLFLSCSLQSERLLGHWQTDAEYFQETARCEEWDTWECTPNWEAKFQEEGIAWQWWARIVAGIMQHSLSGWLMLLLVSPFVTLPDECICQSPVSWEFVQADVNVDGHLSYDEILLTRDGQDEPCLEPWVRSCDTDVDGVLSEKEWCCCFADICEYTLSGNGLIVLPFNNMVVRMHGVWLCYYWSVVCSNVGWLGKFNLGAYCQGRSDLRAIDFNFQHKIAHDESLVGQSQFP